MYYNIKLLSSSETRKISDAFIKKSSRVFFETPKFLDPKLRGHYSSSLSVYLSMF